MHVLRPIELRDEKSFLKFIDSEIIHGITSLPRDPQRLQKKVQNAVLAFSKSSNFSGEEKYLFILEDMETQTIEGCCGINALTSAPKCEYFYRVEVETTAKRTTEWVSPKQKLLIATPQPANASRICALLLATSARKLKLGSLLSLGRFLYMVCHPERFAKKVMAEIRGFIEPNGTCPFWEGVGRHFYDVEFETAMALIERGDQPVEEILPIHPLYFSFLSKEVQGIVGSIHPATQPALTILQREGFTITDGIDLFDGGLRVQADIHNIQTIKKSHFAVVKAIESNSNENNEQKLVSNRRSAFRCCRSRITIIPDHNEAIIDEETAKALNIEVGDEVCYTEIER